MNAVTDINSSVVNIITSLREELREDLSGLRHDVNHLSIVVARVEGAIETVRAEKPGREEVSTIIHTAIEACPERRRNHDSGTHKRPGAQQSGDLALKIALGVITLASTAIAIIASR